MVAASLRVGAKVNDFTAESTAGEPFTLSGARGKPVLALPGRKVLQLETDDLSEAGGIRLFRDGAPCLPQPAIARREYPNESRIPVVSVAWAGEVS